MNIINREPYPSDIDDETYAFILPYLLFQVQDDPRRKYSIREVLNAMLWIVRTGSQWKYLPHGFPPYKIVHQQVMFWFQRKCFEDILSDLRVLERNRNLKNDNPTVIIIDSRTLRSTPQSGHRAGYDGGKKINGTKIHIAVDTLGNLITLIATPANEQDRDQLYDLCKQVQEITDNNVDIVIADQGYTGEQADIDAVLNNMELIIVKRSEKEKGFVLLPKRWIVERTLAWFSKFRRLGRDLEKLASTLVGFHIVAASILLINKLSPILGFLDG